MLCVVCCVLCVVCVVRCVRCALCALCVLCVVCVVCVVRCVCRIIIVRWADISDFFSLIFVGKMCVFVSRRMKMSLFFGKTIASQNGLLIFFGKETHSETKSWKSSRILRVNPFFIFISFFIIFLHFFLFSFFIFSFFFIFLFFSFFSFFYIFSKLKTKTNMRMILKQKA